MSKPSPYQWWDWDKLRRLTQLLRKETEERLKREKEKGVEWVKRWKQYVGYDKLSPKKQLFAVLVGTILDYGVSSECVPLYVQKLKEAGLLDPEKISKVKANDVEAVLMKCKECITQKLGDNGELVRCRPVYHEWYRKSSEWLIKLGKKFSEIVREFSKVLEDSKKEDDKYHLTPSHIYFVLLRIDGIGPKKAAMVARDALVYDHEMTIPRILEKIFGKGEIVVDRGCHTLVFMDIHALRVFTRLGFISVDNIGTRITYRQDSLTKLASQMNKIISPQYVAALAYPDNPGAIDLTIWYLGREICKDPEPKCDKCPLKEVCYKYNCELKGNSNCD